MALAAPLVFSCAAAWAQGIERLCVNIPGSQGQINCVEVSPTFPLPVSEAGYPSGVAPITGNATGTTGAVVGTLAGVAGKTTYICGFDVSAIGGTAAVGPITIAGTLTASLVYQFSSSAAGSTLNRTFTPCIPASGTNTAITITTTADGTATGVSVNSWGYQK